MLHQDRTASGEKSNFNKIVSRETAEQVESGTRRSQDGTGLGLALTKNLVELMGGSIALQSAPERGSVFSVKLPAV